MTSTVKEANLDGRGFNKGQKKADGHSGTMSVSIEQHARACSPALIIGLIISTTMDTGGQSQLLSPRQSWERASTASQPGERNLELNLGTCALSWDAKLSTQCGPHLQSKWAKISELKDQSSLSTKRLRRSALRLASRGIQA